MDPSSAGELFLGEGCHSMSAQLIKSHVPQRATRWRPKGAAALGAALLPALAPTAFAGQRDTDPGLGEGVFGRGKDPVRGRGRRFWHSSRSHNKGPRRTGMGGSSRGGQCPPPQLLLAHGLPHPYHGRAIRSPRCWRCPSPGDAGTLGVGPGVPREGLAEAGAWQWLEGAVVLGIRAVAASQSMSSASGQRVCQGPGLDRCPSPPQPASVPRVVTHGEDGRGGGGRGRGSPVPGGGPELGRAGAQDGSLGPTAGPGAGWGPRSGRPSQMGWNPCGCFRSGRGGGESMLRR